MRSTVSFLLRVIVDPANAPEGWAAFWRAALVSFWLAYAVLVLFAGGDPSPW